MIKQIGPCPVMVMASENPDNRDLWDSPCRACSDRCLLSTIARFNRQFVRRPRFWRFAGSAFACNCGRRNRFYVEPLNAAETRITTCTILTRRTVSSVTVVSFPSVPLSMSSRSKARPSPTSAAGKNLTMRRPSRSPA
eukprot:2235748-Pleurochrysis_carterae.AAC.1